jgi:invasion protein IalB
VREPADETRLLDAMRKGAKLAVAGTSKKGTKTKDVYSLKGFADALEQMHQACAK